jgi:hypothetical protein
MRKNKQNYNNNYKSEKTGFFRNHIDTFAIMGLNIAIAGLLVSLYVSNSSNITAINTRIDESITSANSKMDVANAKFDQMQGLMYQETKDFHARLCAIEERNRK